MAHACNPSSTCVALPPWGSSVARQPVEYGSVAGAFDSALCLQRSLQKPCRTRTIIEARYSRNTVARGFHTKRSSRQGCRKWAKLVVKNATVSCSYTLQTPSSTIATPFAPCRPVSRHSLSVCSRRSIRALGSRMMSATISSNTTTQEHPLTAAVAPARAAYSASPSTA